MSEIWNEESQIEERKSIIKTPQIWQLRTKITIGRVCEIIRKYENKGKIDDSEYWEIICFLENENIKELSATCDYIKSVFGDKLKEERFKVELNCIKESLHDYEYNLIYQYFIEDNLGKISIGEFKKILYNVMSDYPDLFRSDLISKKYREKISFILSEEDLKNLDMKATELNPEKVEISDILYEKKLISDALKKDILKDMPSDYSNLKKSIYIYIKLCQYLSYDSNYYVNRESFKLIHEQFDNLSKIGPEVKKAICYEFVTIFSDMLKDIGIKVSSSTKFDFEIDGSDKIIYTGFRDSHANLTYTVDDIVIFADSTTSVLNGDLINAKMNAPLNGLKCLSVSQEKQDIFEAALQEVYNDMKYDNPSFKKYGDDIKSKPLVEKLKILFDDINSSNYDPVDFISYITSIKHELFTESELDWNLVISYIGKKTAIEQYPVVLFSVNTNDIKNAQKDTVQYLYDPKEKILLKLDSENIVEMFDNGDLFFVSDHLNIPGIMLSSHNNRK